MIRAVVVDDEVHAREELGFLLREHGGVTVVQSCANALEALRAIDAERPDVVFLDIQMPKIDGFQLLAMLDEAVRPSVVFVTAFDEHALDAFEANAIDYLLKPVQPERLARAVEKLERMRRAGERQPALELPAIERIPCLGREQSIKLVDVSAVELVRSSEGGVYVVTAAAELFTDLTLAVLEARARPLVRCHKQYLVNLDAVSEVVREAGGTTLKTRSGKHVPVSRRLVGTLKERLGIVGPRA
jgi:two-component system LytT family response regulator